MALNGDRLWNKACIGPKGRHALSAITGLIVVDRTIAGRSGVSDVDETKLTLEVHGLGGSGYLAADWIIERINIALELATHRHPMALIIAAGIEERLVAWWKRSQPWPIGKEACRML